MNEESRFEGGEIDILYWIGVQNGSTDIAYRVPMMDTGIVEPTIPMRTAGN